MKALPHDPALLSAARRIIWFEKPEEAVADAIRFFAYAVAYGGKADLEVVLRYYTEQDMREALRKAPPGIIPQGKWASWHKRLGFAEVPPMPRRHFGLTDR
jgi:hypothetical protein